MSSGGFSKARFERVHDIMAGYVDRGDTPGLVSLVSRHGEVHADPIGMQAHDGSIPMARDTIFRISSMTKPVTAVAAMILVEECALRLDEPVDGLLPELADRKVMRRLDGPLDDTVAAERPITVRDLLTFRMGFGIVMAPPGQVPIADAMLELQLGQGPPSPALVPGPDKWIRRLGTLPLMHQPGAQWMYNTGADVLGVLIARAARQPFDDFLRERIFEPLGMADTDFNVPASKRGRFASAYMTNYDTGALEIFDEPGGQWANAPDFPSGAAGLVSTIDDYQAFAQMLLNNGKLGSVRVLSRPSVETMTSDHLTSAQKAVSGIVPGFFETRGFGFCMSVVTKRVSAMEPLGRYGWDGGLGTSWFNDPREGLTAILMTQRAWSSPAPPDVCVDFWTSIYQAIDD